MRSFFAKSLITLTLVAALASCMPRPVDKQPVPQQENWGHTIEQGMRDFMEGTVFPNDAIEPEAFAGPARVVKVGLLVPLTGRSAELGKAIQDAAVLALFDKYASLPPEAIRTKVEIIPKDTNADPDRAALAAQEAIAEGAQLILGPLFSDSVRAVAPVARAHNINVISFSNNRAVAGDNTFLFGFQPDEQIARIVKFAVSRGIDDIAVLSPGSAYGQSVVNSLKSYAADNAVNVDPIVIYSPSGGPTPADINKIVYATEGGRFAFDALFLPEGGVMLKRVWDTLKGRGVNNQTTQIIGTGLWDDLSARRNNDLSGSWYASSPENAYSTFVSRFMNTYEYEPPRLASLGYDAVALVATLAPLHDGFSRKSITNPSGYAGPANGIFRFRTDGTTERGLAVMEVIGPGLREIETAPRSFIGR